MPFSICCLNILFFRKQLPRDLIQLSHPACRLEEVDWQAGGGRHAGRDERGEEKDGHGEESVHPGALSLSPLSAAHHNFHPSAALPAAVWDQRSESEL